MTLFLAILVAGLIVAVLITKTQFWGEVVVTAQLTQAVRAGVIRAGEATLLWSVMMRWHLRGGRSIWVSEAQLVELAKNVGPDQAEDLGVRTILWVQAAADRYWEKHGKIMTEQGVISAVAEAWRRYPEEKPTMEPLE